MSSIKVNGEGSEQPYSEDSAPAPRDAYGISKWEAEQALAGIAGQTGLRTVILRPPLVYGPGVKANFHELIQLVRKGFPLPFKGINNRRSFIYIGNLIDAVMKCLADEKACGHTFMVSDGQDVSTPALIEMIARAMGTKAVLFAVPSVFLKAAAHAAGKGDAMERLLGSLWADTGKIRNILGWKPPCELETGLRETMKAEKS
jgi:nucleoside-diphosphate-sugar epimerase